MGQQFDKFLTPTNFSLALNRLQTANRTLFKSLYYEDLKNYALFEKENNDSTIYKIRERRYEPKSCSKFYIPKKKNLVRPISTLSFIDLLVYQALINIIADELHDIVFPYHNRIIFGNIYRKSDDKDAKFFFLRWQDQWKKYNKQTIDFHNDGYKYFCDFDLASFFDTIDHDILCAILVDYGIEHEIVDLLKKCLNSWTKATNRNNYKSNHGIPQGPIASAFLADIYLLPIDKEITQMSQLDLKYFRYVDDIRVLSKTEIEGQKAITYLDLISRDFGLIPQSEKIIIRKVESIKKELFKIDSRFSEISNEFANNNRILNIKTHNQLKKHFISCFDLEHENYLNKTIIGFSLFKLRKDEDVKDVLLKNIDRMHLHFEGIAYYFKSHFDDNVEFDMWITKHINDDNILFQHTVAQIFKNRPEFTFKDEVFEKHYICNKQFWLTKYFLLDWLYKNKQFELIKSLVKDDNYYVNRKLDFLKITLVNKEKLVQKLLLIDVLKNKDEMLALQGLAIATKSLWFMELKIDSSEMNEYVKNILIKQKEDYINYYLKERFHVDNSSLFFNSTNWKEDNEYSALKTEFAIFIQNEKIDPSISLMALNLFNEIVFDKILILLGRLKGDSFGGSLETIKYEMPYTFLCFSKVNTMRNERTSAHYKDKSGNIRKRISFSEYEKFIKHINLGDTYREICNCFF